jgi:hypothetical protein
MECVRPLKASWNATGEVTFNQTEIEKGLIGFKLPCRKCIPCLLKMSREKAVRALHEAQMHEDSIFLTLTYNDESIPPDGRLRYQDFQTFMKKLRKKSPHNKISYMVTGEYGEETKRPHYHACLFGYWPKDSHHAYNNQRGDRVFGSDGLERLWNHGYISFGQLTLDSASYVARYGAKALGHKNDTYKPKHVTSCRPALGKRWIEKYYTNTFERGYVIIDGKKFGIPRYYEDWCKENHPELYKEYMVNIKLPKMEKAEEISRKEELSYFTEMWNRGTHGPRIQTRNGVKHSILERKFKRLKEKQSL